MSALRGYLTASPPPQPHREAVLTATSVWEICVRVMLEQLQGADSVIFAFDQYARWAPELMTLRSSHALWCCHVNL